MTGYHRLLTGVSIEIMSIIVKKNLQYIIETLIEAGRIVYARFLQGPVSPNEIVLKRGEEMQTETDRVINKFLIEKIRAIFPEDNILAEESTFISGKSAERLWLIDPIDGTNSFAECRPGFSIMIAFCLNNIPQIGLIHDVIQNITYYAISGKGIYEYISKPVRMPLPMHFDNMLCWNPYNLSQVKYDLMKKFKFKDLINIESTGLRAVSMSMGKCVLLTSGYATAKIWDTAAAHVFIQEIKGTYTDFMMRPLIYSTENVAHTSGAFASRNIDHQRAAAILISSSK